MKVRDFLGISVLLLSTAACSTLSVPGINGSQSVNYASGSALGARLSKVDRQRHEISFLSAINSGSSGNSVQWSGPGAAGVITPGTWSCLLYTSDAADE